MIAAEFEGVRAACLWIRGGGRRGPDKEGTMGRKLFAAGGAGRFSRGTLAITAVLVAACAITTSVASAAPTTPSGVWRLTSGQTIHLTNMNISAGDTDTAYIFVNGHQFADLGSNAGFTNFSLTDYTLTVNKGVRKVTLEVFDDTKGCGFFSNGPNAVATTTQFSISDGGGLCTSPLPPPTGLGSGNFNGTVTITP
jgi:hypothetical protein